MARFTNDYGGLSMKGLDEIKQALANGTAGSLETRILLDRVLKLEAAILRHKRMISSPAMLADKRLHEVLED